MKSERTIKRWIKELRDLVEKDPERQPTIESRIAYEQYHLLRRVVEDVQWPSVVDEVKATATLIRQDLGE